MKAFIAHLETAEKLKNSFAIIASWRSVQPTVFVSMNSSTTKSNASSPSQFRVRDPDPYTYVSTNFSGPWLSQNGSYLPKAHVKTLFEYCEYPRI